MFLRKKWIIMFSVITMAIFLTACGLSDEEKAEKEEIEEEEAIVADSNELVELDLEPGETFTNRNGEVWTRDDTEGPLFINENGEQINLRGEIIESTVREGSTSNTDKPSEGAEDSYFKDEEEVEEKESSLDPVEDHSGGVEKDDEQLEEESGGEFSEDINDTRDASEIYLETERVMKEAMQEEGHPTVHLSKREFTNMSQPAEDFYTVSGKVYTNANALIGSYTFDISYSDDGGVDYEWKVNYN